MANNNVIVMPPDRIPGDPYEAGRIILPNSGFVSNAVSFVSLYDTPTTYSTKGGQLVAVKVNESGLEFIDGDARYMLTEPGSINSLPIKSPAVDNDIILIEDSADSYSKKRVLLSDLPYPTYTYSFLDLTDTPVSYGSTATFVLRVNTTNNGIEFVDISNDYIKTLDGTVASMPHKPLAVDDDVLLLEDSEDSYSQKYITVRELLGDVESFLSLVDTPNDYAGFGRYTLEVNDAEDGIVFRKYYEQSASLTEYLFSTDTSNSDPGTGYVKGNSSNPSSITYLYISLTDQYGIDRTAHISAITEDDILHLSDKYNNEYYIFRATGSPVVNSGYAEIPVTYYLHSGVSFAADEKLIFSYIYTGSGSTATITYYNPDPVEETVGGIAAGDVFFNPEKDFAQTMDAMFYPLVTPTYVNPSASVTDNASSLYEVGYSLSINITGTLNRGGIYIRSSFQDYRSGPANNHHFNSPVNGSSDHPSTSDVFSISETITVAIGYMTWTYNASYDQGPQPLDSKGNPVDSPLPAGTTSTVSTRLEGVFPLFGTTSDINVADKQPLVSMITGNHIVFNMVAETGGGKQFFDIPQEWTTARPLVTVQTYNTVSGSWEDTGLGQWDVSSLTHDIQGNTIDYNRYTYNGADRSSIQIRLIF